MSSKRRDMCGKRWGKEVNIRSQMRSMRLHAPPEIAPPPSKKKKSSTVVVRPSRTLSYDPVVNTKEQDKAGKDVSVGRRRGDGHT